MILYSILPKKMKKIKILIFTFLILWTTQTSANINDLTWLQNTDFIEQNFLYQGFSKFKLTSDWKRVISYNMGNWLTYIHYLSTPFDFNSNATLLSSSSTFSSSSYFPYFSAIIQVNISDNWLIIYVTWEAQNSRYRTYRFNLSTPFDLTTASYNNQYYFDNSDSVKHIIDFSEDWTKLVTLNTYYWWSFLKSCFLNTAFDISSAYQCNDKNFENVPTSSWINFDWNTWILILWFYNTQSVSQYKFSNFLWWLHNSNYLYDLNFYNNYNYNYYENLFIDNTWQYMFLLWGLSRRFTLGSIATCFDKIQNQNETWIDTGWVCGEGTICEDTILNYKEIDTYTGAYNTYTVVKMWSSTGAEFYAEKWTAPAPFNNNSAWWMWIWTIFIGNKLSFEDLFDWNFVFYVPWYIQSPIDSSKYERPFLTLTNTVEPINFISISWNSSGSLDLYNWNQSQLPRFNCVYLADENFKRLFPEENDGAWRCYQVWSPTNRIKHDITWLIKPNENWEYIVRIILKQDWLDTYYYFSEIWFWKLEDNFTTKYVCRKTDWTVYIDWEETTQEIIKDLDWTNEKENIDNSENSFNWNLTIDFWVLPSVSENFDCSNILNSSWSLAYWNANTKLNYSLINNFKITNKAWSCEILTSNFCLEAYNWVNSILSSLFWYTLYWIDIFYNQFKSWLSYVWTPETWKNYCFFWKNIKYNWRLTSYENYKWETKNLNGPNDLSQLDIYFLMIMLAVFLFNFIKFYK